MLALTRKLCPFLSFLCVMSCGKKMNEQEAVSKPHIESQVPSPTLIIAIEKRTTIYELKDPGGFKFPDQLRVRSNNALGKKVTITYNIPSEDPTSFDYKCIYKGTSDHQMPVERCVYMDGSDLGNITDGRENPLDIGRTIKFESDSDDLKADAIYGVRWAIPD